MKKLLIAMTAAAVGTCAWATDADPEPTTPTVTYLDESFSENWTLADNELGSYTNAFWSYTGDAEIELAITNVAAANAEANYALALNTGSKVLTANFADNKSAVSMADRAYFNATVTFKDPSDTLPELKDSDKFALVVLDNVESIDAGYTTTPATNLWVIAKYGEDGQRAYQLDVAVTPIWLADEHEIVVKAYENVMASGYTACAGFIVMVDKTVCRVVQSCALEGNVINYAKSCSFLKWNDSLDASGTGDLGYLGYPLTAINPKYQKRYCDTEVNNTSVLILSNVPGDGTLKSVDFQGQGVIDDVELAATTTENFGTDSLAIAVKVDDGVTLTGDCANGTLYYSGNSAEITFELGNGYKLKGVSTNAVEGVNGVYSLTIDPTKYTQNGFTVEAFWPVVSFVTGTDSDGNDIVTERGSLSEAIADVGAGAVLKLTDAITLTEAVEVDKDITINLNGKTLSATLTDEFASMFALADDVTLTITDTTGGVLRITGDDRLIAKGPERAVKGAAVAINAGTIEADIANADNLTYTLTGGQYDTDVSAVLVGNYVATKAEGSEYWTVAEKVVVTTYAVTYTAGNFDLTWLNGETYESFTTGTELANGTYTFKVETDEDYKVDSVTVGNAIVTVAGDGTFDVVVNGAAVAIVVMTREVTYPEAEDLVDGKVTTEVATALDELAEKLGGDEVAVTNYITQVCGGNINADTLVAAAGKDTLGLSVNYDLPLMTEVPTVSEIEAEAATTDDAAAFSFQLKVGNDPVEIKKVTDKVRKMIQYGTTLSGMAELTAENTGVALEVDTTNKRIKVKLLKAGGTAGFMKVKLNK